MDQLLAWTASNDQQPYFLMANVANAHSPWAPPIDLLAKHLGPDILAVRHTEFSGPRGFVFNSGQQTVTAKHRRIWRRLYNAATEHVDREVGRLLAALRQRPDWENTIVVITADHGEMLGEHRDIVGHTLSLHDNITHVPLVVRHPDYPASRTVQGVVQTLDLYPTLLEWSGTPVDAIPAAQLQRPSLSAALAQPADRGGLAFAEEDYTDSYPVVQDLRKINADLDADAFPEQQQMIRSATHKFVWCDNGNHEFYDMVADPEEQTNNVAEPVRAATGDAGDVAVPACPVA